MSWVDDLTWLCHVCGEERPDRMIAVYSVTFGLVTVNVRYCRDRPECGAGAPSHALVTTARASFES